MEMKANKRSIQSGIYLVIDPSMDERVLLDKLQISLTKKIAAVQIWDNFTDVQNKEPLIQEIHSLCAKHQTPVLINNQWEVLKTTDLDGVHFDTIPSNLDEIRKETHKNIFVGLTCGNNLDDVRWAAINNIDYISFCSMFPSSSLSNCEIITHETVKKAALIFDKPLFLAGGIDPKNLNQLEELKYDGIAVISGIMNAEHPDQAIDDYRKNLKSIK
jgi:thiamine-phosphate pyrophosphorylase